VFVCPVWGGLPSIKKQSSLFYTVIINTTHVHGYRVYKVTYTQ